MKKEKKSFSLNRTTGLNLACALMMLLAVVFLFVPFWNDGTQNVSINSYVWFPSDHKALEESFAQALGEKVDINQVIPAPVFLLILGVLGILPCLIRVDSPLASLMGIPVGIVGVWGYASCAALRLGSLWWLHLTLCVAALALSVASIVCAFAPRSARKRDETLPL